MSGTPPDRRPLDWTDAIVASSVAVVVSAWAFLWGQSFPEPALWHPLANAAHVRSHAEVMSGLWALPVGWLISVFGMKSALAILAVAGRVGIGVFAGIAYIAFRSTWQLLRSADSHGIDPFFHTRFVPLCAAAALALFPPLWRQGQYASPDFAGIFLLALVWMLWLRGRARREVVCYSAAWLLMGLLSGDNPSAMVCALAMAVYDAATRRRLKKEWGRRYAAVGHKLDARERRAGAILFVLGFFCGVYAAVRAGASFADGTSDLRTASAWTWWFWNSWAAVGRTFASNALLPIVVVSAGSFVVAGLGYSLRHGGKSFGWIRVVLSSVSGIVALLAVVSAVDPGERTALARIGEFARLTAESCAGTRWLFTDGAMDDAFRIAIAERGDMVRTEPLSVIRAPSEAERERLKSLAPTLGDASVFAEGGAYVFRSWLLDRRLGEQRMRESSWQVNSAHMLAFTNDLKRTCGAVMRAVSPDAAKKADALDVEIEELSDRVVESSPCVRGGASGACRRTSELYDVMLWRLAILAEARKASAEEKGDMKLARRSHEIAVSMHGSNFSLHAGGAELEKMLPNSNFVPTPREAMMVSLRRPDFPLAHRFAKAVLASDPADPDAHFACGMDDCIAGEYASAVRHFEKVLEAHPDDPAVLKVMANALEKSGSREKADRLKARAEAIEAALKSVAPQIDALRRKAVSDALR